MASSIGFLNVLPDSYARYSPASTTQAIQRKQEVVFIADQSTNGFSYAANNVIQFNIQSNSEVLIGMETYLEFDLTVKYRTLATGMIETVTDAGTLDTNMDKNIRLEMGGAHSLFNRVEVKTNVSAQTVSLQELYNTAYVLESRVSRRPNPGLSRADLDGFEQEHIGTGTDLAEQVGFQSSVSGLAEVNCYDHNGPWRPIRHDTSTISHNIAVDTSDIVLNMNSEPQRVRMILNTPWLRQNIPLFLLPNGIQVSLTLESPSRAFYSGMFDTDTQLCSTSMEGCVGYNYLITNPRFVGMMVQPSEDQVARYTQEYRSQQGILFPSPGYRVLRTSVNASAVLYNLSVLPGCRSLRYACGGFFNSSVQMATASYATQSPLVNHSHIPYYVPTSYYSWNIGATQFPSYQQYVYNNSTTVLHATSLFSGLPVLIKRLQLVFATDCCELFEYYRSKLRIVQPIGGDWTASSAAQVTPVYPGWYAQDFSRDNGPHSKLTGVDCSVTPLEFRIQLASGMTGVAVSESDYANVYQTWKNTSDTYEFIIFAYFDQWVRIAQSGIVVLN